MNEIDPAHQVSPRRLLSFDALRGFDMFWIIGGSVVFERLDDVWPSPLTQIVRDQLQHVEWQGFHFWDMIFPLFMLIIGVVLPYSFVRRRQQGQTNTQILLHILKRTLILVILGLIYQGVMKFDWANFRWSAVLALIGTSYCLAAVILLYASVRTQFILFVAILLGYWAVLALVEVQTVKDGVSVVYGGGDYSVSFNFISYLDQRFIPGIHPYGNATNGVGPFLSFTGACSVMLGIFAGHWLRSNRTENEIFVGLVFAGLFCLAVGYVWSISFPIVKLIWTSSFVLVAGGYSLLLLALFYYIIDVRGFTRWAFFFMVIGMNALTIYVLEKIVDFGAPANWLFGGIARSTGSIEPIVTAMSVLLVEWGFLYWLYRKKIFIKI
jgi:predicted acyltransferase